MALLRRAGRWLADNPIWGVIALLLAAVGNERARGEYARRRADRLEAQASKLRVEAASLGRAERRTELEEQLDEIERRAKDGMLADQGAAERAGELVRDRQHILEDYRKGRRPK